MDEDQVEVSTEEAEYPSFVDFCFNHPLYEKLSFTNDRQRDVFINYLQYQGKNDAHCVHCNDRSVFELTNSLIVQYHIDISDYLDKKIYIRNFVCARNAEHVASFFLFFDGVNIQKIGQYPSLASTALAELKSYKKVLQAESARELHKAIGLAAHGVGIGAFVYLRRVLENIVDGRKSEAILAGGQKEEAFAGLRFVDKISLLKGHLPDVLVDNTRIYSVLSKGVHELSEDECLKYFPILRELMFLILEEDMENVRKKEHLAAVTKGLESI